MDFVVSVWPAFAMRALGLAIAYLILAAGSALGTPAYLDVSVADLVHDPAVYAGKQVRVHGFLIVAFEGDSVWVDEAAYKSGLYEQGFWVDTGSLKADEVEGLTGRLAYVSGTFDLQHRGHLGLWAGAIEDVAVIQRDPEDTLAARLWRPETFVMFVGLTVIGGLVVAIFLLGNRTWLLRQPVGGAYKPPLHLQRHGRPR